MTQHHPVVWLRTRATTGLKDMPSNAAWPARKAQRSSTMALGRATDAVSAAGTSVGEAITHAGRSVVDAVPTIASDGAPAYYQSAGGGLRQKCSPVRPSAAKAIRGRY